MTTLFRLRRGSGTRASGFSLIELVVSIALLAVLLLILEKMTDSVMRSWRDGQARTDGFQSARTALEVMSRELAPAVVDTRMQFVVAPGTLLKKKGAPDVAPETPVMLWMSPMGEAG
ncbi:MAG: prepilin-type N-terminal cleavage/methylation protein, partial [Chthoniobacteraceae bacterium]|nr:prepilin-type N-terminal cleavage/methylation protein [Chthoniobacteraceae bacterium]